MVSVRGILTGGCDRYGHRQEGFLKIFSGKMTDVLRGRQRPQGSRRFWGGLIQDQSHRVFRTFTLIPAPSLSPLPPGGRETRLQSISNRFSTDHSSSLQSLLILMAGLWPLYGPFESNIQTNFNISLQNTWETACIPAFANMMTCLKRP